MLSKPLFIRAIVLIVGGPLATLAGPQVEKVQGFNYSSYKENTIRAIERIGEDAWNRLKEPGSFQIAMGVMRWKYRIRVKRAGNIREISSPRKKLIFVWAKVNGLDLRRLPPISFEVPVAENDKVYTLAIQDGLARCMEKEVAVEQKMEIYVQYMGYTREEGPIILICEFKAP